MNCFYCDKLTAYVERVELLVDNEEGKTEDFVFYLCKNCYHWMNSRGAKR